MLVPLSVTVQLIVPVPLASVTVLYFKPCISVSVRPVVAVVTEVVPSFFHKVSCDGMLVIVYVKV